MMYTFFEDQQDKQKEKYIKLLEVTAQLSNLFSDSQVPYIYYRSMENIFCKAFEATNLSRSDISIDASKGHLGIGLKTFLHGNGKTFQKVAEFNKESGKFEYLNAKDLINTVSLMRNDRLQVSKSLTNTNYLIYHLLTRQKGKINLYEEDMQEIDINSLKVIKTNDTTILFKDNSNEYSFNKSKSTLYKRFCFHDSRAIETFKVEIMEDPYEFLLKLNLKSTLQETDNILDYIILPLYSPSSGKVELKSGLNFWNAGGRLRDPDEVYIPVPRWIHKVKKDFFKYSTEDFKTNPFNVKLPNGKKISMKIAQSGGKALMSNPNKDLGKWILRDVLNIKKNSLLTYERLESIGIDSIKLSKQDDNNYLMDFLSTGSYEAFELEFNN